MSRQSQIRQKEKAKTATGQRHAKLRSAWIFVAVICFTGIASAIFFAHKKSAHPFISKVIAPFGLTPQQELDEVLAGKDENIDLALVNWLMVAEIPEFRSLSRRDYFQRLDAMTEDVQRKMAEMEANKWPDAKSKNPQTRCRRFCSAIIALRLTYTEEFREESLTPLQMKKMYSNPDNLFLAGLLRTKAGTCVSLPMIYLVVGQRLGLPLHLVEIGKHYFIRWDEPSFRMDIETTSTEKIAWTQDESVYIDSEGLTQEQLRGNDLKNLDNREAVGELFLARTSYWHGKGTDYESLSRNDLVKAYNLAPDDPGIRSLYQSVFGQKL